MLVELPRPVSGLQGGKRAAGTEQAQKVNTTAHARPTHSSQLRGTCASGQIIATVCPAPSTHLVASLDGCGSHEVVSAVVCREMVAVRACQGGCRTDKQSSGAGRHRHILSFLQASIMRRRQSASGSGRIRMHASGIRGTPIAVRWNDLGTHPPTHALAP